MMINMGLKEILAKRKFEKRVARKAALLDSRQKYSEESVDDLIQPIGNYIGRTSRRMINAVQARKGEGKVILQRFIQNRMQRFGGTAKAIIANPAIKKRKRR